ncbi:adenylosuccinate lyase [Candidatus Nitronereus thalassa]|uniref:Adenylosuccinate lyase n=1 Tax=Candidatus Nitronereus thalassa TaxID=3020898 RepID=A0ABU3K4L2_9BACT|nr:adenylosuccinate lyase [Candidatus Nitronereus thalassa]MDT7041300.1 adenylosuccinate lyase [Candidatus Nitronereus thalassa]
MIERYTLPRMGALWTQHRKYEAWLQVELAACEALEEEGKVPKGIAAHVRRRVMIDPDRIDAIEQVTKHDVIAFLESLAEQAGPKARHIHAGLTSSDVLDTGLALQLVDSVGIILEDIDRLLEVLKAKALEHQETIMVGRSHGIHGEPISLGIKFALWFEEFKRHRTRVVAAGEDIAVGKLSGAMGTFAHLPPRIESVVCKKLGLKPAPVSNQIVQRDRHAAYLTALALVAASIEKVATEIRHLQRTEVLEAEEYFSPGQKGSSAMPHKRNPVGSENLCGLARLIRSNSVAAMENVALWHERDISHSSVERIIMPDSNILMDYMLVRLTKLLDNLVVYPDRMLKNLNLTGGLVYSQRLLLALVDRGAERKAAYEAVQRNAMAAWQGNGNFQELVMKDKLITQKLRGSEIQTCFDPHAYLKNLPQVYRRVFGSSAKTKKKSAGATRKKGRA